MLTQLINNSGISICMVGTQESVVFFEQAMQLARRSLGLQYSRLEYDDYFYNLCCTLFSYQYTKNFSQISDGIIQWLYEHSAGVVSVVVSLIHDAQEIAILNGKEELSLETLDEAYKKRLSLLHSHISPFIKQGKQTALRKKNSPFPVIPQAEIIQDTCSIADLAVIAKSNNRNIVDLLREYISITEVRL